MRTIEAPVHLKSAECPCCGTRAGGDGVPEPGDTSVCIGCGAINAFTEKMDLFVVPDRFVRQPRFEQERKARDVVRRMRGLPVLAQERP